MGDDKNTPDWCARIMAGISLLIGIGGLIVAVVGLSQTNHHHQDNLALAEKHHNKNMEMQKEIDNIRKAERKPHLEPTEPSLEPNSERPGVTNVCIRNTGEQEAAVRKITFKVESLVKTPSKPPGVGAVESVNAFFKAKSVNGVYELTFPSQENVDAKRDKIFRMAIIDPVLAQQRTTCIGKVILYYDGTMTDPIPVTLDCLAKEPPSSR